jgi:hypothetical protein
MKANKRVGIGLNGVAFTAQETAMLRSDWAQPGALTEATCKSVGGGVAAGSTGLTHLRRRRDRGYCFRLNIRRRDFFAYRQGGFIAGVHQAAMRCDFLKELV